MNRNLQFLAILAIFTFAFGINHSFSQTPVTDSVVMGAGYVDEVYYSMANGTTLVTARNTWDIAFRSRILSSSILTNDGKGVVLYTYPNSDTSGWNSIDTTGLFNWTPMYNDPNDWENGAFSRNATGGFDFGWAVYNQSTHFLTGDSLFVIKLRDGSFRKLWIQEKKSGLNLYFFKYANLDGSGEQSVTLDCNPYTSKDFVGFSIVSNQIVDFQPEKSTWDILFTKYMSVQPNGTPYPVTGVVENDGVKAEKYEHVSPSFVGFNPNEWDSTRSVIGYGWKFFDGSAYQIVDSLVYFVKTKTNEVYKIVFKEFGGSVNGLIVFEQTKLSSLGINTPIDAKGDVIIYPNPVNEKLTVYMLEATTQPVEITLMDLSGKIISSINAEGNQSKISMNTSIYPEGTYLLNVTSGNHSTVKKVIISR